MRRSTPLAVASVLILALAAAACGTRLGGEGRRHDNAPPAPVDGGVKTGCVQGVVVDGVTGDRHDLVATGAAEGINVLVGTALYRATSLVNGADPNANPMLKGEYLVCGVPLENVYPIFVWMPGYQPFEGRVYIPASAPASGTTAEKDRFSLYPTVQANIRLYPLAPPEQPYTFVVTNNGSALANARIVLAPTGGHVLAQGDGFLPPYLITSRALSAVTDAGGGAVFPAAELTLGGVYRYTVIPPDGGQSQRARGGYLTVGYLTSPGLPYTQFLDLPIVNSELVVVSTSLATQHYSEDGSVTYYFNRPVELVPGSEKAITAELEFAKTAALADDVPGNEISERVTVEIQGHALTLRPVFKVQPRKAAEPGLAVEYGNVRVRPVSGQKLLHALTIAPTVSFWGGYVAAPVATSLVVISGGDQSASPGEMLADPIVVEAHDQYGQPMAGQTVAFAVPEGGGMASPVMATTNGIGRAQTFWFLGMTGTQRLTATLENLAPVSVSATFLDADAMTIVAGTNNQNAVSASELPVAIAVRLVDENGFSVQGASVTFAVADQTNGGTLSATSGGAGAVTATVSTNSGGQAAVFWRMGTTQGGAFTATATAGSLMQTFTATARKPTTIVNTGTAPADGAAMSSRTVEAEVRDQNGQALPAGVTVAFAVTAGGGNANPTTAITNGMGRVTTSWTYGAVAMTPQALTLSITSPTVTGSPTLTYNTMTN